MAFWLNRSQPAQDPNRYQVLAFRPCSGLALRARLNLELNWAPRVSSQNEPNERSEVSPEATPSPERSEND